MRIFITTLRRVAFYVAVVAAVVILSIAIWMFITGCNSFPRVSRRFIGKWESHPYLDGTEWDLVNPKTGEICSDIYQAHKSYAWHVCNVNGSCLPDNIDIDLAKRAAEGYFINREACSE